jgi:hypothetical protein
MTRIERDICNRLRMFCTPSQIDEWMTAPSALFGWHSAEWMIDHGHGEVVLATLNRIEAGANA